MQDFMLLLVCFVVYKDEIDEICKNMEENKEKWEDETD